LPAAEIGTITQDLRSVPNEWLKDEATSEQDLSLGGFSIQHISNFDEVIPAGQIGGCPLGNFVMLDALPQII
jgi:hypothetical protein